MWVGEKPLLWTGHLSNPGVDEADTGGGIFRQPFEGVLASGLADILVKCPHPRLVLLKSEQARNW